MMRIAWILCAFLVTAGLAPEARAEAAQRFLTVSVVNSKGQVLQARSFDLANLDALPQAKIVTHTPWTHGIQTFTGPALATFANLEKLSPKEVRIYSLGDWSATVPAADWKSEGVILASRLNGVTMRVRDKGPYWIMYPIDGRQDLDTQMYQARMVWQVKALEFVVE